MECIEIADNCRACQIKTQEESPKIFIFNTVKLPDIFKETTSLDIQDNDGLPKVLCYTCYDRLLEAYNFRKMCAAAVVHFQKIISSMDVPEEKYIPPENLSDINLTDTTLMNIKTEPDLSDAPKSPIRDQSCSPEKDDSLGDISDTLSIDDKLLEVVKTEPSDDCPNEVSSDRGFQKTHENADKSSARNKGKEKTPLGQSSTLQGATKGNLSEIAANEHICGVCGARKDTEDELKSHMNIHHNKDNLWSCVFCSYKSQFRYKLQRHVKTVHQGIKDYHCPECSKSFTTLVVLKQHMLRHKGIKNHECKICGIKKVTLMELKTHLNTHTKEKNFPCELCSSVFTQRHGLKQHVKIFHHGVKDYHCPHCDKAFGKLQTLKNHVLTHTGEKPHACNECGKRYTQKWQMTNHMKKNHNEPESKSKKKQKSKTKS